MKKGPVVKLTVLHGLQKGLIVGLDFRYNIGVGLRYRKLNGSLCSFLPVVFVLDFDIDFQDQSRNLFDDCKEGSYKYTTG